MQEKLQKDVASLHVDKKVIKSLKENNINTIYDLCKCSRMELSSIGLLNSQITDVAIALQLLGLDLKKNHAKKNLIIDGKKK